MEDDFEFETNFKVILGDDVKKKIDWLVSNYDKEIGGFLVGDWKEDSVFIDNILFPKQDVSSASIDTDGMSLIELRKEYGNECLRIVGHFHSHNTLGAFWSGDDETFMKEYSETNEKSVFIVASTLGNKTKVIFKKPFKLAFDLNFDVDYGVDISEEMLKVIEDKVIETKIIQSFNTKDEDVDVEVKKKGESLEVTIDELSKEEVQMLEYDLKEFKPKMEFSQFLNNNKIKINLPKREGHRVGEIKRLVNETKTWRAYNGVY